MVVDRGRIGSGMTARTTAHLSANNDDGFKTFIDRRGEKLAKRLLCEPSGSDLPHRDHSAVREHRCDFRRVDGFLFPGPQTDQSEIDAEREASKSRDAGPGRAGATVPGSREDPLPALSRIRRRFIRPGTFVAWRTAFRRVRPAVRQPRP